MLFMADVSRAGGNMARAFAYRCDGHHKRAALGAIRSGWVYVLAARYMTAVTSSIRTQAKLYRAAQQICPLALIQREIRVRSQPSNISIGMSAIAQGSSTITAKTSSIAGSRYPASA
jgi:hypothetical protein